MCVYTHMTSTGVNTAVGLCPAESPLQRCAQQDGIFQAVPPKSSKPASHPTGPAAPALRGRPPPHKPAQQASMPAGPHSTRREPACPVLFKADFGAGHGAGPAAALRQPARARRVGASTGSSQRYFWPEPRWDVSIPAPRSVPLPSLHLLTRRREGDRDTVPAYLTAS